MSLRRWWRTSITLAPEVLAAKPAIRGTWLSVEFVIGLMADGWSEADILENYPGITQDDIIACLAYAHDFLNSEKIGTAADLWCRVAAPAAACDDWTAAFPSSSPVAFGCDRLGRVGRDVPIRLPHRSIVLWHPAPNEQTREATSLPV
jgi:uncharacterized protein (DUF433 family)